MYNHLKHQRTTGTDCFTVSSWQPLQCLGENLEKTMCCDPRSKGEKGDCVVRMLSIGHDPHCLLPILYGSMSRVSLASGTCTWASWSNLLSFACEKIRLLWQVGGVKQVWRVEQIGCCSCLTCFYSVCLTMFFLRSFVLQLFKMRWIQLIQSNLFRVVHDISIRPHDPLHWVHV